MAQLDDLDSLKRAFYRLLNSGADDDARTEFDPSENDEALEQLLQYGAWDAQEWLLDAGLAHRWITTIEMPDDTSGTWQTKTGHPGKYADLPYDFLRLAGDENISALREGNGDRWGMLVDRRDGVSRRGNAYWLQNERLWLAETANPPGTLYMDYHHELPELDSPDFPKRDRPLIVAFAGQRAVQESWVAGGSEMYQKIDRYLAHMKEAAYKHSRQSRQPRQFRTERMTGSHWFW